MERMAATADGAGASDGDHPAGDAGAAVLGRLNVWRERGGLAGSEKGLPFRLRAQSVA